MPVATEPAEDGSVRFSVTDTGPGIPEEQHVLIFEKMDRARAWSGKIRERQENKTALV